MLICAFLAASFDALAYYIYKANDDGYGNFTLYWAYTSYNTCLRQTTPGSSETSYLTISAYRIKEWYNGVYVRTSTIYSGDSMYQTPNPPKHHRFTNRQAGTYTFELKVTSCSNSGQTSYIANTQTYTIDVSNQSRPNKPVIFIHTDVLGSPVAETDEQGNVIQ